MLKLYENIKKRRIQLNISQQELAELVGYRGRSMVSQIESGNVDLPLSMIKRFADALKCSPAYLMGWMEENVNASEEFQRFYEEHKDELPSRLAAYFDIFAKLSPESQDKVIDYMNYQIEKENNNAQS